MFHLIKRGRLFSARIRLSGWSKWRTFSLGVSDKRVAHELAENLVQKMERQAAGILPSDAVLDGASKRVSDHLAAFLAYVEGRGRTGTTLKAYRQYIPFVLQGSGWEYFGDITANSFEDWRALAKPRPTRRQSQNAGDDRTPARKGGSIEPSGGRRLSPKYLNDLLGYVRAFMNWAVRRHFLDVNPLRDVEPIKLRSGRGHRRALSRQELEKFFKCSPPERRAVYMASYFLGLRRTEMRRLKCGDFDLNSARPVVRIPGIVTKNAKPAVLDIPAGVIPALRFLCPSDKPPFAYGFSPFGIPNMETFRSDVAKAGICFKDAEERRFDFHALRLTLCTHLRIAGVSKRRAMAIMRLSSERLLDHVYFDDSQLSLADEMSKLPVFGFAGPAHGLSHGAISVGLGVA